MNKRNFLLGFFTLLIVGGLSTTVYLVGQQQNTQQNAQVYQSSTHDSCKKLTITASELPVCPRLNGKGTNDISSYTWTADIKSNDSNPSHKVTLTQYSDFCTGPYATGSPSQCNNNPIMKTITVTTPYQLIITRSPTVGNKCGVYQADLYISAVDNNATCTYTAGGIGASGLCETGIRCSGVTPTPTLKVSPTPTITPTPRPTPPPGVSFTPVPTTTPTPPVCVANEAVCHWIAGANATTYHYTVKDDTGAVITQGDTSATEARFILNPAKTYTCSVTAANTCGSSNATSGTSSCLVITPTPTVCTTPGQVKNVKVSCPNCN